MTSPHLLSCQKQCTCWSISAFPRCLELFLFPSSIHPFIHYSCILFSTVGWVLSSPTDGVLLGGLPDCEVLVTNHHCFRSAYGSWDFIDTGQWRPSSYKFGSADHHNPDRFLHKPVFGIEDCASRLLLYCFSLVPLWTHQLVYESWSVRQWQLPFQGIQGSILCDLFLAHAAEDTVLDFGKSMNKHMLDYEGQFSGRCTDVCLM